MTLMSFSTMLYLMALRQGISLNQLDILISQLSRFLCLHPQLLWSQALAAMLTFLYGSQPFNIRSSCMQSSLSYLQSQLHIPVTSKLIPFFEIIGCQLTWRKTCFINFPFEVEEYLYVCVHACMYICTYNLSGILGFQIKKESPSQLYLGFVEAIRHLLLLDQMDNNGTTLSGKVSLILRGY